MGDFSSYHWSLLIGLLLETYFEGGETSGLKNCSKWRMSNKYLVNFFLNVFVQRECYDYFDSFAQEVWICIFSKIYSTFLIQVGYRLKASFMGKGSIWLSIIIEFLENTVEFSLCYFFKFQFTTHWKFVKF